MSAYSVTGVGQGSALKEGQKGAEDMFLGVEKLIGPRIVFASSVTLVGGTATVTFPQTLPGVAADYMVLTGGAATFSAASSLTTSGFTMTGTGTQTIFYAVVKLTNATVVPPSYPYA